MNVHTWRCVVEHRRWLGVWLSPPHQRYDFVVICSHPLPCPTPPPRATLQRVSNVSSMVGPLVEPDFMALPVSKPLPDTTGSGAGVG